MTALTEDEALEPIESTRTRTGYVGVYPDVRRGRWQAQANHVSLGLFVTAWEAGCAVTRALRSVAAEEAPAVDDGGDGGDSGDSGADTSLDARRRSSPGGTLQTTHRALPNACRARMVCRLRPTPAAPPARSAAAVVQASARRRRVRRMPIAIASPWMRAAILPRAIMSSMRAKLAAIPMGAAATAPTGTTESTTAAAPTAAAAPSAADTAAAATAVAATAGTVTSALLQ